MGLLRHQPEIGDVGEHADEAVEQAQAVLAQRRVLVHDHDVLEEDVDRLFEGRKGTAGGIEVLASERG